MSEEKKEDNLDVYKGRVMPRNPLGMIAVFVFLIETIATVSLKIVVGTPYAKFFVWFIICYPSLIALLFFVFLWFKREALYAPADFPDVKTFKELIQKKFEHLEIKQDAARIDLQTDLSDVYRTVDRLMELEDTPSAIGVGRSFLQDKQFDKSIKIFSHIHEKIRKNDRFRYKLFANIAYAKIGLGQYDDAIGSLLEVKKIEGLEQFAPWHSLALAYAYFKLGNSTEYKRWIDFTRKNGGPDLDIDFFEKLYPEIAKEIRSFTR